MFLGYFHRVSVDGDLPGHVFSDSEVCVPLWRGRVARARDALDVRVRQVAPVSQVDVYDVVAALFEDLRGLPEPSGFAAALGPEHY